MANMQMAFDEWKRLSIAVGIACCELGDKTVKDVLKRADSAMMDYKDDHYARR